MTTPKRAIALAAALLAAVTLLAACTSGSGGGTVTETVTPPAANSSTSATASTAPSTEPASSTSPSGPTTLVHVRSMESDGATYGVGMPIVLYFSPPPTDSRAFTKAVKVTVDGRPADGAWYWEQPTADEVQSQTYEAHYRMKDYWPAHSHIHVDIPIGGLSAGQGLAYSDKL